MALWLVPVNACEASAAINPETSNHVANVYSDDGTDSNDANHMPAPRLLELNAYCLELNVGETYTLVTTEKSEYVAPTDVIWKSYDESIATVSEEGFVTAIKPGMTMIDVKPKESPKENPIIGTSCIIKVSKNPSDQGTIPNNDQTKVPSKNQKMQIVSDSTATEVPQQATLKKVISPKKKTLKATWKRDSKATGYQVVIATDKKFKKNKKTATIAKNKTVSKTFKKLKSKKTYYAKVRAYKKSGSKKVYGAYSKVKKVKVK